MSGKGDATRIALSREADGGIARLQLCRAPLNILDIAMLEALGDAVEEVAADDAVRVLAVEAGEGCRAFSAGVDVADHTPERVDAMLQSFHRVFRALDRVEVPTVAVVSGAALGGGCELAAGFDIVVAGAGAKFGQPEIRLGAFAPVGSLLLPPLIGTKRAADWLFTGRTVDAAEAASAGLVSRVVPDEELAAAGDEVARTIAGMSGAVLRMAKTALRAGSPEPGYGDKLDRLEQLYLRQLMATDDAHEGLAAFAQRRSPVWSHR